MSKSPTIIYTETDEAPALATQAFLPVIQAFAAPTGVAVETRDISLAARILAVFPEKLTTDQRVDDALAELGELAKTPDANIIKLPNISASVPQMKAAIAELQAKGYDIPSYPEEARTDAEREAKARYDKVKGSAVNPVLREGNSDRRAPMAVKQYARNNPHPMGAWSSDSKTHVSTMSSGDFRSNEQSVTVADATTARIEHVAADGSVTVLKDGLSLLAGEIIDGTVLSKAALLGFLAEQVEDARKSGVLFSLHMKATMMKVSDPIIFGHAVRVFFTDVFAAHGAAFDELGVDVNNGFGDLLQKISSLPADKRSAIEADIKAAYGNGPSLAMVNSDKGITNLHVPSDVIVDASMPAMIRTSGQHVEHRRQAAGHQGGHPGQQLRRALPGGHRVLQRARRVRPDHDGQRAQRRPDGAEGRGVRLARQDVRDSERRHRSRRRRGGRRTHGARGTEPAISGARVSGQRRAGAGLGEAGRIARARATGWPTVFWLDAERPHDAQLIAKVETYLKDHDTDGLERSAHNPVAGRGDAVLPSSASKRATTPSP